MVEVTSQASFPRQGAAIVRDILTPEIKAEITPVGIVRFAKGNQILGIGVTPNGMLTTDIRTVNSQEPGAAQQDSLRIKDYMGYAKVERCR